MIITTFYTMYFTFTLLLHITQNKSKVLQRIYSFVVRIRFEVLIIRCICVILLVASDWGNNEHVFISAYDFKRLYRIIIRWSSDTILFEYQHVFNVLSCHYQSPPFKLFSASFPALIRPLRASSILWHPNIAARQSSRWSCRLRPGDSCAIRSISVFLISANIGSRYVRHSCACIPSCTCWRYLISCSWSIYIPPCCICFCMSINGCFKCICSGLLGKHLRRYLVSLLLPVLRFDLP